MRESRLFFLLLVAYGWLFVFFERINNPNELVRVYAARALIEEHSWSIGRRVPVGARFADIGPIHRDWGYVNDKALVCDDPGARPPFCAGKLYAAKAPGAPVKPIVRALPVYGNSSLSRSIHPGEWFSTVEIARARARTSPERTRSTKCC